MLKALVVSILIFLNGERGFATSMHKTFLNDNGAQFDVMVFETENTQCAVLFAVGSGGNPERHLPLLAYLSENGCKVIAPYFDRLSSPMPTKEELDLRARRLRLALDSLVDQNLHVVGVGHSIGATILLALSGGQLWLGPGQQVPIHLDTRLKRLVLMTPPTGFFRAPYALDNVHLPMQVWAGTNDAITPPDQAEYLKSALQNQVSVDLRVVEGAGHYSFLNTLPPQIIDPLHNREKFLADLAGEIGRYVSN